jgi:hypothetical protein
MMSALRGKNMTTILELAGVRTKLYPAIQRKVRELDRVTSEKITKWRMFSARWTLHLEDYYGKPIRYEGSLFEGSPREVFWGRFIEPFLENGIVNVLDEKRQECLLRNLEPEDYLDEAKGLLRLWVEKTYRDMARTDQVLRGKGYPDSVPPVNVSSKISAMHEYVDRYVAALIHQGDKPSESKAKGDIIEIKPNFYGIGLNFNELWRRIKAKVKNG